MTRFFDLGFVDLVGGNSRTRQNGNTFDVSRVAKRAKMTNPAATIQVTTIELVIGKPRGRAISTAFLDRPCSSGSTTAEGTLPCSAFLWPAPSFADVADPPTETNAAPSRMIATTQAMTLLRIHYSAMTANVVAEPKKGSVLPTVIPASPLILILLRLLLVE